MQPPTLQERLAGVVEHLEDGGFSPADVRAVADALDDLRALQARLEDAAAAIGRGEWSVSQAQDLADALRQWANDHDPEPEP